MPSKTLVRYLTKAGVPDDDAQKLASALIDSDSLYTPADRSAAWAIIEAAIRRRKYNPALLPQPAHNPLAPLSVPREQQARGLGAKRAVPPAAIAAGATPESWKQLIDAARAGNDKAIAKVKKYGGSI